MQITVHLDTQDKTDLAALAALVAALGGRAAPTVLNTVAPPPPPAAAPMPETPKDAAEVLLQQEAARVSAAAPPPPPADDDNSGPAVDPKTIDKDGIPWDVRIHSTPPKINADGTWRKKRGLSEVTYGEIHAELQAAQASAGNPGTGTTNTAAGPNGSGTVETPAAPPPPASSAPTASAPPPPPAADVPNAPAPPSANTAPPAAENAPGAGRFAGFPEFVQAVNSIRSPTIPYLELNSYAATLGVTGGFKDIKDHAHLWEDFYSLAGGQ